VATLDQINLIVGDMEAMADFYRRLGVELPAGPPEWAPPYDAFWGSRFAVVTDPDGNAVGLMSPRDDAFRGPSPSPPPG